MHSVVGSGMIGAAAAPVMKARCRVCGKFRSPREFVHGSIVGYCWHCYEWHQHALACFAGDPPRGCQECGATYEQLERSGGSPDVRFGFHSKDGVYQILGFACGCSDAYERKRLDLYGRTPYGAAKKLMGSK
jgi:hypothetical protein